MTTESDDRFSHDWCPISFTFSPSILEIRESKLTNVYSGGLSEYLKSFYELEANLRRAGMRAGIPRGKGKTSPYGSKKGARKYPEIFINFVVFIGSTGIAAGLYHILKTWVETKNGRKIRVRVGSIEIETTQMTEKQFVRFLARLIVYKRALIDAADLDESSWLARVQELEQEFRESGFKVSPAESYYEEDQEISCAAKDSISRARGELGTKPLRNSRSPTHTKPRRKRTVRQKKAGD